MPLLHIELGLIVISKLSCHFYSLFSKQARHPREGSMKLGPHSPLHIHKSQCLSHRPVGTETLLHTFYLKKKKSFRKGETGRSGRTEIQLDLRNQTRKWAFVQLPLQVRPGFCSLLPTHPELLWNPMVKPARQALCSFSRWIDEDSEKLSSSACGMEVQRWFRTRVCVWRSLLRARSSQTMYSMSI